jgi:uncharacterized protein with PIN domain
MTDEGDGAGAVPRFIVDHNAGKLVRWLRMMGFDCTFFTGEDDTDMVNAALYETRTILTRDTGIAERRLVKKGYIRLVLLRTEIPEHQMRQVMQEMELSGMARPFTRCIECNHPLEDRMPEEVKQRVPPYVAATQTSYRECPACRRIYWRGTHWEAMMRRLAGFLPGGPGPQDGD